GRIDIEVETKSDEFSGVIREADGSRVKSFFRIVGAMILRDARLRSNRRPGHSFIEGDFQARDFPGAGRGRATEGNPQTALEIDPCAAFDIERIHKLHVLRVRAAVR